MITDKELMELLSTTNTEELESLIAAIPVDSLRPVLSRVLSAYHGSYALQKDLWYQEHEKRMKLEKQLEDIRKKISASGLK